MEPTSKLNILFILNSASGGKKKRNWEPVIRDYFKPLSHNIEFYVLTGKDDPSSIQYWLKKLSPLRVVAVGGDGTISFVAQQLSGTNIPMGILRGGSANGMATELKIPEDPSLALDVIMAGKTKICDLIKINDDFCIHLSDLGLNARIVKYFDKTSFRGMWGYGRVFFKILWEGKLMQAHIVADNLDITIPAYMVVIANASKYGTGAVINPEGQIHDGLFELVIVRKISFIEMSKMFFSNKPFDPKKVEIFKTTKASITTKRRIHFQVDGEYKGKVKEVVAEIIPSAVKLLVQEVAQ
ncbi:MAG: diacylglycerol kinase family lipid kinase [Bacteroidota bacterium]|nr:diacylglycerol kinase family lipid kinase [Bacteroidota bacterium]